jgi:hypothetical protein
MTGKQFYTKRAAECIFVADKAGASHKVIMRPLTKKNKVDPLMFDIAVRKRTSRAFFAASDLPGILAEVLRARA